MADFYLGKINLDKLDQVRDRAYNGKLLDFAMFITDEPDQYGNNVAIKVGNAKKGETVVYIGNAKKHVPF